MLAPAENESHIEGMSTLEYSSLATTHAQPARRYHVALVISLSIPAHFLENWALSAMAGVMFVCTVLVAAVQVRYDRR